MPTAPGRACGWPGCHRLTSTAGPFCSVHQFLSVARSTSAAARGYGATWRRLSEQVLREEPWCRLCLAAGRQTPSRHCDHIKPKPEGTDERKNLRGLCHSCHSRRTNADRWDERT